MSMENKTSQSTASDKYAARVIQVIETNITRRGDGKDAADPVRVITQYWTLDGKLICEIDPVAQGLVESKKLLQEEIRNAMRAYWKEQGAGYYEFV